MPGLQISSAFKLLSHSSVFLTLLFSSFTQTQKKPITKIGHHFAVFYQSYLS